MRWYMFRLGRVDAVPHEGLTQTQETQAFEDTQVMEETEEGEIDVNLEGRVTQVVEGG